MAQATRRKVITSATGTRSSPIAILLPRRTGHLEYAWLARLLRSFKVAAGPRYPPVEPAQASDQTSLWIDKVACLHDQVRVGTSHSVLNRPQAPVRCRKHAKTCLISTPSSFLRLPSSFSCGCAAYWASAPGAS